jgi:uroporphyrinogen-III synthase
MSADPVPPMTDLSGAAEASAGAAGAGDQTLPLVLVTRPQPQADEWVAALQALGLRAQALPLLGIAAPADPAPVQAAWHQLPHQAVVMFVSPSAVQRFFAVRPGGLSWPAGLIAAGTGPGTRQALLTAGVPADGVLTPPDTAGTFDSEALWAVLQPRVDWPGRHVLVVRGEGGRDWLADTLRQHGAQLHVVEAYRRTAPVPDAAGRDLLRRALAQPAAHCWLFSSSEAVNHLPALAPGADWRQAVALASHPRIADTAELLGFGRVQQVAPEPAAVAAALRALAPPH